MTIKLNILANDILETEYSNSRDCAITRALARAGFPNYEDCGTDIIDNDTEETVVTSHNETYWSLSVRVMKMYRTKRIGATEHSLLIEDFEHTLEF